MEIHNKEFYGESCEIINPFVSIVEEEGEDKHAVVGFEIDGYSRSEDGNVTMLFSPDEACNLANEILKVAKESNKANYNLLRHKAPF